MKLVSFLYDQVPGWGMVTDGGVVALGSPRHPTLKSALAADALEASVKAASGRKPLARVDDLHLLPVIPDPGKIFCVGHNYEAHRVETGRDPTSFPLLFMRVAESQTAHNRSILRPPESVQLDYEGEIALIIGKPGRRIKEAEAWSHIAGYSAYNDGSVRDWQKHTLQFTAGKNFTGTGSFGPWMVTRDEIADGEELRLQTRLNGQVVQDITTASLIFSFPTLIAYISTFTSLEPGDVIVTGTPGGVGAKRSPPLWMQPGDRVEVEVTRIGVLANTVAAETP